MKTIIFDLDGTLALIEHRRHWVDKEKHPELSSDERWRKFFAACIEDLPNYPVIRVLQELWGKFRIVILSGRSDEVRNETEAWLLQHGIRYDQFMMRAAGDHTPDEQLKKAWLAAMDKDDIFAIFDDRDKVVQMWRAEGLTCFQVANGDF